MEVCHTLQDFFSWPPEWFCDPSSTTSLTSFHGTVISMFDDLILGDLRMEMALCNSLEELLEALVGQQHSLKPKVHPQAWLVLFWQLHCLLTPHTLTKSCSWLFISYSLIYLCLPLVATMTSSSASGEIILFKKNHLKSNKGVSCGDEFNGIPEYGEPTERVSLTLSEGQRARVIVSWVAVIRHYANTVKIKALLSNSGPLKSHDLINQHDLRVMQVSSLNQPRCPFSSSVWKKCCHTLPAETTTKYSFGIVWNTNNSIWKKLQYSWVDQFAWLLTRKSYLLFPQDSRVHQAHRQVYHVEANFLCITQATTPLAGLHNLILEHFCGLVSCWHVLEISLEMGWLKIIH